MSDLLLDKSWCARLICHTNFGRTPTLKQTNKKNPLILTLMVLFRLCSLWLISTLTHTHDRHRLDWSTLFFIWFKKPTKWKLKVSCLFHFTCLHHQTQADKTTWISWLVYVYMYIYSINIWLYIWILMHMNYNSYWMMPELSLIQDTVIITFLNI